MSEKRQLNVVPTETSVKRVKLDVSSTGEISRYTHICFFALIGCSIRLGIDHVMGSSLSGIEDSGSVIFKAFFSNMFGCFCLGLLAASSLSKTGNYAAVYTGISTGLCGSITTYSKWNQQVALLFIGETKTSMLSPVVALASIATGLCSALASLCFGKDMMTLVKNRRVLACKRKSTSQKETAHIRNQNETVLEEEVLVKNSESDIRKTPVNTFPIFLLCFLTLFVCGLVVVFSLGNLNHSVLVIFTTILMAPFGASLRYALSKLNKISKFPLGTFTANALGSALLAGAHVLKAWLHTSCGGLALISAFGSGFVACLTTVSTFMSETSGKRKSGDIKGAYFYVAITFTVCQILAISINGGSHTLLTNAQVNITSPVC